MRWSRLLLVVPFLTLFALSPAAGQNTSGYVEPPNLNALIAAAAKEGQLTLAVGNSLGGPKAAQAVQDGIKQKYHIDLKINYAPVSGGVMFVRQLTQEVRAGQTASSDIMFTIDAIYLAPYVQKVGFKKYTPWLPDNATIYDSHAVKVETTIGGFAYNTKLVPANDVPKSFADMLKPEWKGKIASSPYQGSFINYIGLPSVMGHQGMLDYVKKFSAQLGGLFVCGETDRVVSGEFAIFGLDCGDHETRLRQRRGQPIAEIYPKEGTQIGYIVPAIPVTAPHPNAARLFITYLLTKEGQQILWDYAGEDCDLYPGSHMGAIITNLRKQGVKFVDGPSGTGLDVRYPQLAQYAQEVTNIISQGK